MLFFEFPTGTLPPEVQTLIFKYINLYQNGIPFLYPEENFDLYYTLKLNKPKTVDYCQHFANTFSQFDLTAISFSLGR